MDQQDLQNSEGDELTDLIDPESGSINTSSIPRRSTVLDYPQLEQFPTEKELHKRWMKITEFIRRKVITDPEVREKVATFATAKVNEQLPLEFLKAVSTDEDISQILPYLELPSVPDEFIKPDVFNAQIFFSPEKKVEQYSYMSDSTKIMEQIRREIRTGGFLTGLTYLEKDLILTRYKFARDVKMLALMASIFDQKVNETDLTLPSGIKIGISENVAKLHPELFDPSAWLKRKQIKDRVYLVTIGSKQFILKERKTPRHKDTNKGGHIETLTSEEEFKTAQFFNEKATLEDDGVALRWEKPVCYVEFPDGFQFTVFEAEENLLEENVVINRYVGEILTYPERYKDEYNRIKQKALDHLNDPEVVSLPDDNQRRGLSLKLFGKKKLEPLSFREFCQLKALISRNKATRMQQGARDTLGYGIHDVERYLYQVTPGIDHKLVCLGFDFEHYYKKTPTPPQPKEYYRELLVADLPTRSKIEMAAYIAMGEEAGLI